MKLKRVVLITLQPRRRAGGRYSLHRHRHGAARDRRLPAVVAWLTSIFRDHVVMLLHYGIVQMKEENHE